MPSLSKEVAVQRQIFPNIVLAVLWDFNGLAPTQRPFFPLSKLLPPAARAASPRRKARGRVDERTSLDWRDLLRSMDFEFRKENTLRK
jgi:hypothetical protein